MENGELRMKEMKIMKGMKGMQTSRRLEFE